MTTTQHHEIMAWLGPAAADLTAEQIERLTREADAIARRWPDDDEMVEREAALSAACQYLLGEIGVNGAGQALAAARLAAEEAFAAAQTVAAMATGDGMSEVEAARLAAIDRMTLRKALGKR